MRDITRPFVPAQAGTQTHQGPRTPYWVPAFAGTSGVRVCRAIRVRISNHRSAMAGLVPAIPFRRARCARQWDARAKPGMTAERHAQLFKGDSQ
jgi:hypothetical protein